MGRREIYADPFSDEVIVEVDAALGTEVAPLAKERRALIALLDGEGHIGIGIVESPLGYSRGDTRNWENDQLHGHRLRFEKGYRSALLRAFFKCAIYGLRPPRWLANAFIASYISTVFCYEHSSWDDVFAPPHAKNTPVARNRIKVALQRIVYERVCELRLQRPKPRGIYQIVSAELPQVGGEATVKRYFLEMRRRQKEIERIVALHAKRSKNDSA